MDANALFENHSIEEVRNIERKLRHDIEWKKEEMRNLVGERYRDLISAADTIKQMKACAENVNNKLQSINSRSQSLKDPKKLHHPQSQSTDIKSSEQQVVYEVACQINLLLAVPGRLWKYVDKSEFLPAAKLYLLAKHINSCLNYDTQTGGQVLARFPVIGKQWAAIGHFKTAIIQGCKQVLSDYNRSHSDVADALCSILMLEDKTPRQVFQEFLVSRIYTGKGITGAKNHVRNAICLVHSTIHQIVMLFYNQNADGQDDGNNIANTLSQLHQLPLIDQLGLSEFSKLKKHLPKSVATFMPSLRIQNAMLPDEYFKTSCEKWLDSCLANMQTHIKEQLAYVTSVKSLAVIREAVYKTYLEENRMKNWTNSCQQLLGRPMNIWLDKIQPLYLTRVKEIIAEQLSKILTSTESQLAKAKELLNSDKRSDAYLSSVTKEVDLSHFIWSESANDLPTFESWITAAQKTFQNAGGLLMKAHGFTPVVQNLCSKLNSAFSALLEDLQTDRQNSDVNNDIKEMLDVQEAASKGVSEYLSREGFQTIERLSDLVLKELDAFESMKQTTSSSSWILLLGRFCCAAPKLCPDLEKCVTMPQPAGGSILSSKKSMSRSLLQATVDPVWSQSCDTLLSTSYKCYSVWTNHVIEDIQQEFAKDFIVNDITSALQHITRWDDIEIDEVTEDGRSMKSSISVPMQITWCLQKCLSHLCRQINSVGSHSMSRELQLRLVASALENILRVYKTNAEINQSLLTQNLALQYLFDIWYIQGMLLWKSSDRSTEIEKLMSVVIEELQSKVDPFDLDVFTPHIQRHINIQRTRHLVLFGAITDTERVSNTSTRQTLSLNHSENHNTLAIYAHTTSRFPLIPVSDESFRSSTQTGAKKSADSQNVQQKAYENKLLSKIQSEPVIKPSASFYDRLGSGAMSWFTGGAK